MLWFFVSHLGRSCQRITWFDVPSFGAQPCLLLLAYGNKICKRQGNSQSLWVTEALVVIFFDKIKGGGLRSMVGFLYICTR